MGKLIVIEHLTLDGVMQAPARPDEDTRDGFQHGGWAARGAQDPRIQEVLGKHMTERWSLLLGRTTYEDFYAVWPKRAPEPIAEALNGVQKYVASTTLSEPLPWQNSTLLEGDAGDAVARLKTELEENLVVRMTDSANRSSAHGPSVNSRRPDPRITWANCKLSVRATQDGGQTWQAVAQLDADPWVVDITRSVFALTFATLNDGWAYRPGGGGALWATHDGGVSWSDETGSDWSVVDLQASGGAAWRLDVSGSCRSIETDCNWRTARTDDGGLTWQLVAAQPAVQSTPRTARLAVRSATEAWVASQGELLVTRDGGASWQARTTPCGAAAVEWPAAFAPALDGQALWMICSGQPGAGQQLKRAYVSTDDGQSWTEPGPPSWAGYVGPLVALSADRALWVWRVAAGWCWGRATAVRAGRSSCARRTIATVW